jgi:lipopolysaccharide transport system ATP-binding protein
MSNYAVEFTKVWKKFKRGENFDSLRDLIPSAAKRLLSRSQADLRDKEFWALRDVSFQMNRGEALGIIGPNGSGKSTALKLLGGILRPDRGNLGVKGRLSTLIELGAGFHPDLTGRENIFLNGTILGMKRAEIAKKFDQIVEFSELEDFIDTPVKRYSSGMYARLGFSVAAHVNPEVLVIDEVLSVGDYHFQQKCFDKMREFVKKGTSLIFVSHNMTAVSTLCNRALLLRSGEPIYYGDVSVAMQKYHSFYEDQAASEYIEVVESHVRCRDSEVSDILHPGETINFEVKLCALRDLRKVYPGLMVHTVDGLCVFVTATSRLSHQRLDLGKGECATVTFTLDMNLRGDVFLLGFTLTPELEVPGEWLYYNPRVKKIVMRDDPRSHGLAHLNPRAELKLESKIECQVSAEEG